MDHGKYLSSISTLIDPKKCIQTLKAEKCIEEREMRILCEKAKEILLEEPNVQSVALPALIVGDIHGQFHDLIDILSKCESDIEKENIRIVFMGDFVDRGYYSVETFEYLLCLKLLHPGNVILLRGNHESRQITMVYGFYDEITKKYGNPNVWKYCVEVFDCLSIACLIENKIFCVHAGLSPEIPAIDLIQEIDRRQEIPHEGPFSDLMWSDPEDIDKWAVNQRGAGWLFGSKVVDKFNYINNIDLICRSHQLVNEGYKYWFNKKLVIVWSAPNYCYRCGNSAATMKVENDYSADFTVFKSLTKPETLKPLRNVVPYFL